MKYRPSDAELLDVIAALLEDEVLPVAPPAVQHKVRVAANLTRILQRQQDLEPAALRREGERIAALLGRDDTGDVRRLRTELDRRIRAEAWRTADAGDFERQVWDLLVATARDDVAVAKPGHDSWEGE